MSVYSHSVIVYLLHDKDLAFCFDLLINDKIRQSDDNFTKHFRTVAVENINYFLAFIDYT